MTPATSTARTYWRRKIVEQAYETGTSTLRPHSASSSTAVGNFSALFGGIHWRRAHDEALFAPHIEHRLRYSSSAWLHYDLLAMAPLNIG